jgi:hypothetical protein
VALRHSLSRRIMSVARIAGDVVRTNDALAVEGGRKHLGIARHRKFRKRFERRSGQRVKHIAFAGLIDQVVKERSEFGAGEFDAGIRHDLNEASKVGFDRQRRACAIENLKRSPFLLGGVFRPPLRGAVPHDLRETNHGSRLAEDRRHLAGGPHSGPLLADAPSFLAAATTIGERVAHLTRE